jgi:hypothetical protein
LVNPLANSSTNRQFVNSLANSSTDRQLLVNSLANSSTDRQLVNSLANSSTDRQLVNSLASSSTNRQLVNSLASSSTDRQLVNSLASSSTDRQLVNSLANLSTDRQLVNSLANSSVCHSPIQHNMYFIFLQYIHSSIQPPTLDRHSITISLVAFGLQLSTASRDVSFLFHTGLRGDCSRGNICKCKRICADLVVSFDITSIIDVVHSWPSHVSTIIAG